MAAGPLTGPRHGALTFSGVGYFLARGLSLADRIAAACTIAVVSLGARVERGVMRV